MDSAKVSFSSTQNAVHLVCVSGSVSVAGSEHITIDNIYETPVNASLARCVGTRPTKRVREQQMPCYQQQNIYIYIVSSHRTVNVRIGRYVMTMSIVYLNLSITYDWVAAWGHFPCWRRPQTWCLWRYAQSSYDVQLGSDFNMLETLTHTVNWPKELAIYGPWPDLWPLNFGP